MNGGLTPLPGYSNNGPAIQNSMIGSSPGASLSDVMPADDPVYGSGAAGGNYSTLARLAALKLLAAEGWF